MKELRAESFDELTDGRTNGSDYYISDFFKRKGDINSVLNNSPVMLGTERKFRPFGITDWNHYASLVSGVRNAKP